MVSSFVVPFIICRKSHVHIGHESRKELSGVGGAEETRKVGVRKGRAE